MKKFIFCMLLMMAAVVSTNAQVAYQKANVFDNTYVGIGGTASTPLRFDNVFPLNSAVDVKLGKQVTPILGFELEGAFYLGSHQSYPSSTVFRASDVTLAGLVNLSNLFCGYKGEPRFFEVVTNTGLGWNHRYGNIPTGANRNDLTAKTGLDLNFNLGKAKAWTIYIEPAVLWNLTANNTDKVQFNRNYADLALSAGVVYHFKNSAGKHHIKQWNVGEMNDEINTLRATAATLEKQNQALTDALAKKTEIKETPTYNVKKIEFVEKGLVAVVQFAKNSDELTDEAKAELDKIGTQKVNVIAYASPEGTSDYNMALSVRRADVVAKYLISKGKSVESITGAGADGKYSNRIALVSVVE